MSTLRDDPRHAALPWQVELHGWACRTIGMATDYIKEAGLDPVAINAFAGTLTLANVAFRDDGGFALAGIGGEPAAVIEVLADIDGERRTVDVVAWALENPEVWGVGVATFHGRALGGWHVDNPTTWHAGRPLAVHRTPLGWLQAGCVGTCILDHASTADVLNRALGPIFAEDADHGRELRAAGLRVRIGFPAQDAGRMAA